ncbi:hypothetical protein HII13_002615 [Brettanomyces bruxellensis]|uniref:DEBR0S1_10396g1_1 n=1 Tax=Dekkera bruxellensis TaxID=5007 RepID=A0A7D9H1M8_DEKBR|nr:putative mitochondrial complex ndufs6_13 kd subunit [Brettanomyces bruxellensis AWRI1499]KAF6011258.1 hypothetical protein HII13_002615 [Brettanomyces bruxellensis]KAF6012269.1 hypothetical protein HII12_002422 [Brettanomyces bruxellensis]VUG16205.1 DEBR0S1_10396g1_1 [Brettanomyces bruxellensis]
MFRTSFIKLNQITSRRFLQTSAESATKTAAQASKTISETPVSTKKGARGELETAREQIPIIPEGHFSQAPNRDSTWSPSQISRGEVYKNNVRFVGRDLSKQPFAEAAIELTKMQPIHYVSSDIAVCQGTTSLLGHPKVYINLDKDMVGHCGYCGAKYAREELKGKL